MNLYAKLFGLNLMRPVEDDGGAGAGGGSEDRGDDLPGNNADPEPTTGTEEDDLKTALGDEENKGDKDDKETTPRDKDGKFAKKDREATIPKTRFDEAVRRERERAEAAERELNDIRKQQQQVKRGADIGALEDKVKEIRAAERKALIAGEDDKAAELSTEADRLNRQIAIEQSRDMSAQAKEQAREEIRWDLTIERIETEYPALNPDDDGFDQELTDEVADAMEGIMRRERLPRSQAILKAVQKVMGRREAPKDDAKEDAKGLRGAAKEQDRKEAAVKKNLDAANRQPAGTKKVGADSDKHGQTGPIPAASDMTFEEFNALPDSTRAKMRGDFV